MTYNVFGGTLNFSQSVNHLLIHWQVNGRNLVGVTHHDAVDVLKEAGNDVSVVVGRMTKKPKPHHLPNQRPTRTTRTSYRNSGQLPSSPTTNGAPPPQPVSSDVELCHQKPASSPMPPTVPSANQSVSPELLSPNRLSGTASPPYEVIVIINTIQYNIILLESCHDTTWTQC